MKSTFSEDQYDLAYPDGIEYHWWNMARSGIVASVIAEHSNPGANILEIGAGRGVAVKHLRARGLPCFGVELAAVASMAGLETYVQTGVAAEDLPLLERQGYNTLLLLDVIEHLPDPAEFIAGLRQAFPQLSSLVITVPAGPKLWSNYDEFYGHHRRYTLAMLDELADELGCAYQSSSFFFHVPYLPARLLCLLGVKRSVQLAAPRGPVKLIHKLLAGLMRLEYLCLPGRLKGSSAVVCFKFD
jgi:hypothetical protein